MGAQEILAPQEGIKPESQGCKVESQPLGKSPSPCVFQGFFFFFFSKILIDLAVLSLSGMWQCMGLVALWHVGS